MQKKSELYKMFIHEFFETTNSDGFRQRAKAMGEDNKDMLTIAQQSSMESVAETLLNMLGKLGVIEDDCELTQELRKSTLMEAAKKRNQI